MKVNRWTILACSIAIIACLASWCTTSFFQLSSLESISLGILASFVVATILAVIEYLHERETLLAKAAEFALGVYINLCVLEKALGIMLGNVQKSPYAMNEQIGPLVPLAKMNVERYESVLPSMYSPFLKKSKVSVSYNQFCSFKTSCGEIYLLSQDLMLQAQQFDLAVLRSQQLSSYGMGPMQQQAESQMNISLLKEQLLIKTAKLHERVRDRAKQYESIVCVLVDRVYGKDAWIQKREYVHSQAKEMTEAVHSSI